MRSSLVLILLAAACCFVSAQKVRADVVTVSDASYYEPTNSIWAWSEVRADYGTLASYCIGNVAYVYKNDVEVAMFNGSSCDNAVYGEVFLPYDPNAEYMVEANPGMDMRHQGADGTGYNDIYNFMYWANLDPIVYAPAYFGFNGPGPEVDVFSNSIFLGTIFSLFTAGGTAGPPDHLKVVSDTTTTQSCGSKRRLIKLKVVDGNGRYAGRVQVVETLEDPNNPSNTYSRIYNSCQDNYYSPYRCAGMDLDGTFTDQLWAGCPSSGGNCGFPDFGSRWWW